VGSRPDEVNFSIYLILPAALGPVVTQPLTKMSTGNIKIMFLANKVRPVRRADKFTAIYEPTVQTMCGPYHLTTL
jgi:hypothetical protein